jgi:hypothetical protein
MTDSTTQPVAQPVVDEKQKEAAELQAVEKLEKDQAVKDQQALVQQINQFNKTVKAMPEEKLKQAADDEEEREDEEEKKEQEDVGIKQLVRKRM